MRGRFWFRGRPPVKHVQSPGRSVAGDANTPSPHKGVNRCHGQDPFLLHERHNLRHGTAATRRRPRRPDPGSLPGARVARVGGHGARLPGPRHPARPAGRPQGAAPRDGVAPGEDQALRARGEDGRLAEPPRDRDALQPPRGAGRAPLPDHGARRRRDAQQVDPGSRLLDGAVPLARHRGHRRGVRGPPPGDPAPGPQARERDAHPGRAAEGARLRPRQAALRRRRGRPDDEGDAVGDPGRAHRGHRGLHVAGAGPGPAGGPPLRHLRARHPALRDGHRRAAVPRQHEPLRPLLDPQGHAAAGE